MHHFLNLLPHSPDLVRHWLKEAARLKACHARRDNPKTLCDRVVGMVFEKPSLRTRLSFEAGVAQLGGSTIFVPGSEISLGVRESLPDFARTISQFVDAVVLRVFKQSTCEEVAKYSSVPVVNGLSDMSHPCQALADLLTIEECFGKLKDQTVVFVGDGNNVAKSLAVGCGKLGLKFVLACPKGYGFDSAFLERYTRQIPGPIPKEVNDPMKAVEKADAIYTDVWTSMGQEAEREERLRIFAPYQVNEAMLAKAPKSAKILHCLPAHRGEEITNGAIEGPASVVFQQAGNRLHVQKAVLEWLFAK